MNNLLELLYQAYRDARRHKRFTFNQLKFERNLESNLVSLYRKLEDRNYEISKSVCFISNYPVKREIIAADFRDRVVHHLLYNWIYPLFERIFIFDTYSCRIGKGTHFGIHRAYGFMRSVSDDFRKKSLGFEARYKRIFYDHLSSKII